MLLLLSACVRPLPPSSGTPCLPRSPPLEAWVPVEAECVPEGRIPVRNAPGWLEHLRGADCPELCDPGSCDRLAEAFAIQAVLDDAIQGLAALGVVDPAFCSSTTSRGLWACAGRPDLPPGFELQVTLGGSGRKPRITEARLRGPFLTPEGEGILYAGPVRADCSGHSLWMVTSDPSEIL